MKLRTVKRNGKELVALETKENQILPLVAANLPYETMNELIDCIKPQEMQLLKNLTAADDLCAFQDSTGLLGAASVDLSSWLLPLSEVEECAPIPIPKQDIICLGINYMDHAEETARSKEEDFSGERPYAVYFSKRVNEAIGNGSPIPSHQDVTDSLDYEAELAVIIGKEARNVAEKDAFDYIFGYTVLNDVSARNLQMRHEQWYFGKSLDGFVPMGPAIVTADEIPAPPVLHICSRINGELRQESSTRLLIFGIAHVISELSQGMTLKPGTIISMGTPAGVGMGFQPPKWLHPGDVVECEIENIGILKNTVL